MLIYNLYQEKLWLCKDYGVTSVVLFFYLKKGGIVMANRGNKPLQKKEGIATPTTLHCLHCNGVYDSDDFYDSDSELHASICKIPYCAKCLDKFYQNYLKKYISIKKVIMYI